MVAHENENFSKFMRVARSSAHENEIFPVHVRGGLLLLRKLKFNPIIKGARNLAKTY